MELVPQLALLAFASKPWTGRLCTLWNFISCSFATKAIGFGLVLEHNIEQDSKPSWMCGCHLFLNSYENAVDISYLFFPAY